MKPQCPYCQVEESSNRNPDCLIKKVGTFYRSSDRKNVQRYRCARCLRYFSSSTLTDCYKQKKRHLNGAIAKHLVTCTSLRETAWVLGINRKTVARRLIFWGIRAEKLLVKQTQKLKQQKPISQIQFDDMESFIHTKCKPVAISLAVQEKSRYILALEVSEMPAKGLLAKIALKKYGQRLDQRAQARGKVFSQLQSLVSEDVHIKTDESTHYINDIKNYFPRGTHKTYKGRRGAIVGQGELKKIAFDPLFSLNHTAAMARYKVSRLVRRTWCTSKKIERLRDHLYLMAVFHNLRLDLNMQTKGSVYN